MKAEIWSGRKPKTNLRMTFESACNLSESEVVDGGTDKVMNLQETETTTYFVSDSGDVGPVASHLRITTQTHSGSQSQQDENSEEAMKEHKFNSKNEVLADTVGVTCEGFSMKSSATVNDSHCRDDVLGVSGTSTEHLKEEHDENFTKQQIAGIMFWVFQALVFLLIQVAKLIVWKVTRVLFQSDAVAAINAQALPTTASEAPAQSEMQNPKTTSEGHHSKAGFPSFTNVDNQSQGRQKNEEIIAKATNWSTGKQHIPLKSLLGEANLETKLKSPIPKQTPTVTKSNDGSATTVNSILGPEATANQVAAQREMGKEWNSPARYLCLTIRKRRGKSRGDHIGYPLCAALR
ncbi:hypothetical protein LOK49_LG08G02186 [Camellia lanceoleosa]|uniref:Uncharacterized protein n=1 Tax=Camellia lanceoleosa TaxID=1840588 RepID=A0ACC0GNV8_9ERIC|nr:hypothetical protein LOK49_LG08G02186 [Camellia lanceoleosa]